MNIVLRVYSKFIENVKRPVINPAWMGYGELSKKAVLVLDVETKSGEICLKNSLLVSRIYRHMHISKAATDCPYGI